MGEYHSLNNIFEMVREQWGSRLGFILTTAGFAIGIGNIWRFPYVMGQNGGGIFLLIYILCVLFIALPLMVMEVSLGRKLQLSPIVGMRKLKAHPLWQLMGWLGYTGLLLIIGNALVIISWVMLYLIGFGDGHLTQLSPNQVEEEFLLSVSNFKSVTAGVFLTLIIIYLVGKKNLQKGLEKIIKLLMPILCTLLLLLTIWANTLEGAWEGLKWYLYPDFSQLNSGIFFAALGQAFYSVGVGMFVGFVFGSYLKPKDSDVPGSIFIVVALDTLISFVAGLLIFPALFAFNMSPDSGSSLLFVSMTNLFLIAPFGRFLGVIFFAFILLAAITSILSTTESMTTTTVEFLKINRKKALIINCILLLIISIIIVLSFGKWQETKLFGLSIFALLDFIGGNIFLPLGALVLCLYVGYRWKFSNFMEETNQGASRFKVTRGWAPLVKYVIPLVIISILAQGIWDLLQ